MNFIQFPSITPSSMNFDPPVFPVGVEKTVSGVTVRRRFGNRPTDGRLSVEFRNISNAICANILLIHLQSKGLAPILFDDSFFLGAGPDLQAYLNCDAYQGLSWYFIEESPPRLSRVEGAAELSNLSVEFAARLIPNAVESTSGSIPPPAPLPGTGNQTLNRVFSVEAEAPVESTGGSNPVISILPATQTNSGYMSDSDKIKLDSVEHGAQQNVIITLEYIPETRNLGINTGSQIQLPLFSSTIAGLTPLSGGGNTKFLRADAAWAEPPVQATDLSYNTSTRVIASSTGEDAELPIVSSTLAGLAPASGGGTANFLRADAIWAPPPIQATDLSYNASTRVIGSSTGDDAELPLVSSTLSGLAPPSGGGTSNFLRADATWAEPADQVTFGSIAYTTSSLAAGAVEDFAVSNLTLFKLLSFTSSTPSWIRIYGTSSARSADTRTSPGGTVPAAGTEFYAELATSTAPQTIRLSPVPVVQPSSGQVFIRIKNIDTVTRTISVTLSTLSFGT